MIENTDEEEGGLRLTAKEKGLATVLVVETEQAERQNMRSALKSLGFGAFTDVPTHLAAFEKMQERRITHIIFDARKTNMPPSDFVKKALEYDENVVLIPSSHEPNLDDVFELLVLGAKGYLCKPFTADSVEAAIANATKGEPIAESVKMAKDRNEALVAIMMGGLDRMATVLRQATKFETAKREIPRMMRAFRGSTDLAKTFAKGGDDALVEAIQKFCLERGNGPATRLGRLRKKLNTTRATDDQPSPPAGNS